MFTVFILTVKIEIVTLFTTALLVFLRPHQPGQASGALPAQGQKGILFF
jgi:hypothetical protein